MRLMFAAVIGFTILSMLIWSRAVRAQITIIRTSDAVGHFYRGPKLVGTGVVGHPFQGEAVAVSGDGNTAIVAGANDNAGVGAAWVWTKSGRVWAQQGAKLVGAGAVGNAFQGISVSMSADGSTAIVGGASDNADTGAAWVWTRNGGVWTQQGAKLVGSGAAGSARQGSSVSLSADGNTALVGGAADDGFAGAAWVWTRSNGVWTQQGSKLVGSGAVGIAGRGTSVALSADGTTAIVGGYYDNNSAGAAWVWTRSGDVWTQQGVKLVGSGAVGNFVNQGGSVSLSVDGNTAIVGGPGDDGGVGAAWVWTRSGGVWTQQGPKLVGSDIAGDPEQGISVSLSSDGNTAIVGGDRDNFFQGAAWLWARSGGVWTQQGSKLVASGSLGQSVSLSADGHTALAGAPQADGGVGAAWVFAASTVGDIDGDAKTDRTIFRPSSAVWYSVLSGGGASATAFGAPTDVDVAADYDGDGQTDIAVWRPSTTWWYVVPSSGGDVYALANWGIDGDIAVPGDVDGDGKADVVIWRPSTGAWFILKTTGGTSVIGWGMTGDQPLFGDFDHDGKMDLTIYRPGTGVWYAALSGGGTAFFGWGTPGDLPVAGDFDGDGKSDATIFRPSTGDWLVNKSTGGTIVMTWGLSGDVPVSGDWDGDGKSDFTVWRPSNGVWYTQFAVGGAAVVGWGVNGDRPIGRQPGT